MDNPPIARVPYEIGKFDQREDGSYRNEPRALGSVCPTCGAEIGAWCAGVGGCHAGRGGYTKDQITTDMALVEPSPAAP